MINLNSSRSAKVELKLTANIRAIMIAKDLGYFPHYSLIDRDDLLPQLSRD